jgi:hypothetical protein
MTRNSRFIPPVFSRQPRDNVQSGFNRGGPTMKLGAEHELRLQA